MGNLIKQKKRKNMIADKFAERAPHRRSVMLTVLGIAAAVVAAGALCGGYAETNLAFPANAQCWNKKFVITQDVVGGPNKYKTFWRYYTQYKYHDRSPKATNDEFMLAPLPNGQVQMTRVVNGNPQPNGVKPIFSQAGEFHFRCLQHCAMFWPGTEMTSMLYNPKSESFVTNFASGNFVIFGRFA